MIFMKCSFSRTAFALLGLVLSTVSLQAAGHATADFDNARPNKGETAFGRLVADSARAAVNADLALVNAGSLKAGSLKAGNVEQAQIDALLAYDDEVVIVTVSGAKLREALEQAVREYPTGDNGFLHGAGLSASFAQGAPPRIQSLRVNGRDVAPNDTFRVAMPKGLANGADGYFKFWDGRSAVPSGTKVSRAIMNFITQSKNVSPDPTARIAPR